MFPAVAVMGLLTLLTYALMTRFGRQEVDLHDFCRMMTLHPSAICHGDVSTQAAGQLFTEPELNGIDCWNIP